MVTGKNARDILPKYGNSGIYCYDEQHVRIKGKKKYRQTVYDGIYYEVVNERVCDRIDEETISDFLIKTLGKRKVFAIISDGGKGISRAIEELEKHLKEREILSKDEGILHQRCIFHLLKDFNKTTREVEKINKRKKAMGKSIKGIEGYSRIRTLLHLTFSLDNKKIVKECMDELPEEREWIKKILDKKISKEEKAWKIFHCIYGMKHNCHPDIAKKLDVIHDKWKNFTYFYIYEKIPKTNDPLEQYYAQTHPMLVKKQFKTDEGLEKHLLCKALFNNAIGKNVTLQGIKENLLLAEMA